MTVIIKVKRKKEAIYISKQTRSNFHAASLALRLWRLDK